MSRTALAPLPPPPPPRPCPPEPQFVVFLLPLLKGACQQDIGRVIKIMKAIFRRGWPQV